MVEIDLNPRLRYNYYTDLEKLTPAILEFYLISTVLL